MLAPYAKPELTLIALLGVVATVWIGWYFPWWALAPLILMLALLAFYRNPFRKIPAGANLIVAPADGRVVEIVNDARLPDGTSCLKIMIFLSVLDVHVNRSPCRAKVTATTYKPGRFMNALAPESSECNECNTIVLEPAAPLPGPIRVRQIAGILARRIVCAVRPGDELTAGQLVGMIKLGSRTEICLPAAAKWQVEVILGQQVKGGSTVLARLSG
jgi:phosphatidylserine decarboxylase